MKVFCKKDLYYNGDVRRFVKGNYYHILYDLAFEYIIEDDGYLPAHFTKNENNSYKYRFDDYFTMIPELRQQKLKKIC